MNTEPEIHWECSIVYHHDNLGIGECQHMKGLVKLWESALILVHVQATCYGRGSICLPPHGSEQRGFRWFFILAHSLVNLLTQFLQGFIDCLSCGTAQGAVRQVHATDDRERL